MTPLVFRFFVGGVVVSIFAILKDLLKPKSFAGLIGAAPSVALAMIGQTILTEGTVYAAEESRSMIAGAAAFFLYACLCIHRHPTFRSACNLNSTTGVPASSRRRPSGLACRKIDFGCDSGR